MADDFSRLVSLACHDLRTPLATVQGFAKTLLRLDDLDDEKRARYLGLVDKSADELVHLLDLLSLAARIEGGRYDPVVREADSLELAPDGSTGSGTTVRVDPEAVERALAALVRAASRHGGVDVACSVDGSRVTIEPIGAEVAAIVLGDEPKDLGAAIGVRLLRAIGGEVVHDGERVTVTLPV